MEIQAAHLRHQGIDFAVFGADARTHLRSDRAELLDRLVTTALIDLRWRIDRPHSRSWTVAGSRSTARRNW
jgi:hypothetical protein